MRGIPAGNDYDGWVRQLAFSQRRQQAKRHLLAAGSPALPALRRGLEHPAAVVRRVCVGILDHLVDEESLPNLVAALDDDDAGVRARALHALACDRCKQNECRPGEDLFVPRAIELLRTESADVRAAAIDALGKVVTRRPEVAEALELTAQTDPNLGLRNIARRHVRRARSRVQPIAG